MNNSLLKPEYYFQPSRIWQKVFGKKNIESAICKTCFNTEIIVQPKESIGIAIANTGVYDLVLSEMIYRLLQKGDTAVDVGANIGYFTQLMSLKIGLAGKVHSFEPNPLIIPQLQKNITQLTESSNVELHQKALSDAVGSAALQYPDGYDNNNGLARISNEFTGHYEVVEVCRLDEILNSEKKKISVLKIDAEGHEYLILKGAEKLLRNKSISHIFYEDFDRYPSNVGMLLTEMGYTIYRLEKGFLKPLLRKPDSRVQIQQWDTVNYVATLFPKQVEKAAAPLGYRCLM